VEFLPASPSRRCMFIHLRCLSIHLTQDVCPHIP
jgi:hypothetical protein